MFSVFLYKFVVQETGVILKHNAKISFAMRPVCDAYELRKLSIGLKTVFKKSVKNSSVFPN